MKSKPAHVNPIRTPCNQVVNERSGVEKELSGRLMESEQSMTLPSAQHQEKFQEKSDPAICCRACGQLVTRRNCNGPDTVDSERTFRNPAGYSFHVKVFGEAEGCRVVGEAVSEASWFPDYAWRLALCRECDTHLGWRFEKSGHSDFWGMIVTRLTGV